MGNKASKEGKIIKEGEDVTSEVNEKQATETDSVSSPSVITTGIINEGSMEVHTLNSTVISGHGNTVYMKQSSSSNPDPDKRIEFNIQNCVHTFTGREEFLETLHENITKSQSNKNSPIRSNFIVICGMAGVGKTQVARKYVQTYKEWYHHVIWINAEKQSVATSCFLRLAAKIQIDVKHNGRQKTDEDILDEVYDFIFQKRALIVYDNAGSYRTEDGKDNLHTLLPQNFKTVWTVPSIIVITRNRKWPDFMVQELEGFELSISLSFLAELKFENTTDNEKLLTKIAELYQGLPLVLQQVLHYVRKKRERCETLEESYTLSDFLREVNLNRKEIISMKPADLAHSDVYSLFDMTFKDIATMKDGKNALQCLDIMVIFDPDFISTILLKYIFRNYKNELANGLKLLHDYNLVTQAKKHYQIHRVVQAARIDSNNAKLLLDGISEKCETSLQNVTLCCKGKQVVLTFEEILNSICDLIDATAINSENIYELLNNIVQLHDQAHEKKSKQFIKFQTKLGYKLFDAGNYRLAGEVIKTLIKTRTKTKSQKNLPFTAANVLLGHNGQNHNKLEDVQDIYKQVPDRRIEILGRDDSDILYIKQDLASIFQNQGKYSEAEKLYNEVLDIRVVILGPDHPDTLDVNHSLATLFQDQGKYREAEKLYNEVLDMRIKILGPDHPKSLFVKSDLASIFENQGKYSEAEKLYNEVLDTRIKILGPDHPNTLFVKSALASIFQDQGKYSEAEKLYNEVLDIRIKKLGPDHPSTIVASDYLGHIFYDQGKYSDAEKRFSDVLQSYLKLLGPDHPRALAAKQNIACCLQDLGKYNDAEVLFNFVLNTKISIFGMQCDSTFCAKHDLAVLYQKRGKYNEADQLHNEVLKSRSNLLGCNNPETLRTKHELALDFLKLGRYNEAEDFSKEVLEMRLHLLGPDHPDTLLTKHNLAQVFQIQGKYSNAEELLKNVLEGQLKMLCPNHPDTLLTKRALSGVLLHQGKSIDAEQLCKEVLQLQINQFGQEHPEALLTKYSLAGIFQIQGKTADAKVLYNEVLPLQIKVLGPEHPDTLKTKFKIEN